MTKARWIEGATCTSKNSSYASKQEFNNTISEAVLENAVVMHVKNRTVTTSVSTVQRKTAS